MPRQASYELSIHVNFRKLQLWLIAPRIAKSNAVGISPQKLVEGTAAE
jgi:hypothetical protein